MSLETFHIDMKRRFPDYDLSGKIVAAYMIQELNIKNISPESTLPSTIRVALRNNLKYGDRFTSMFNVIDHQYLLTRPAGFQNINTVHPYLGNSAGEVNGFDETEQLAGLLFIQDYINTYLMNEYNPTHKRKYEFMFINETFYGAGLWTVMGMFPQLGSLDDNNFVKKHRLYADSTDEWLNQENCVSEAQKQLSFKHELSFINENIEKYIYTGHVPTDAYDNSFDDQNAGIDCHHSLWQAYIFTEFVDAHLMISVDSIVKSVQDKFGHLIVEPSSTKTMVIRYLKYLEQKYYIEDESYGNYMSMLPIYAQNIGNDIWDYEKIKNGEEV